MVLSWEKCFSLYFLMFAWPRAVFKLFCSFLSSIFKEIRIQKGLE